MSTPIVRVIAQAVGKMSAAELRALFAEVAKEFEIELKQAPEIPPGWVLVPREMNSAMFWAAMDNTWTAQTAGENVKRMWEKILSVVPQQ